MRYLEVENARLKNRVHELEEDLKAEKDAQLRATNLMMSGEALRHRTMLG